MHRFGRARNKILKNGSFNAQEGSTFSTCGGGRSCMFYALVDLARERGSRHINPPPESGRNRCEWRIFFVFLHKVEQR